MKIGLISDTHISKSRGKLSNKVLEAFKGMDLILHAGDINSQKVLDKLNQIAPIIAVEGNNDRNNKSLNLKSVEIIEIHNLRILLTHGDKLPRGDYNKYFKFAQKHDANILISGHSHKPHLKKEKGILLVNPGSPNKPIKSEPSIAILTINEKEKEEYASKLDQVNVKFIKIV
ncbi:metallophosphoesterase [uncultured Methanobrevibacter sp.]|uniref:metallophosphoesterase n=1 Tax=uncultured Methanobrevibacter sp. TaxID=253161 RepID=UPI0025E10E6D|nr:metallophosphoesterase [uncultured Methanobrevibacter sp.]